MGLIFFCSVHSLIAQDSLLVHALIKQIQDQQVTHDAFFMPGIFPSYFSNKKAYKEQRKDNNIFYTALILYTLKSVKPKLSATDQSIVDSIVLRSQKLFAQFKNRKGSDSYNFWRTDSAYRIPYIKWIHLTKKNILPDDPDCTSICLLSLDAPDSTVQKAHALMQDCINDTRHPTQTTFSRYRSYAAYSGWLGKYFPVVFDVCALSNILTFVQAYNLTWTKADSASLNLIIAVLNHKDHIAAPIMVAPYYGGTSVILYHLARLMSIKPIPALETMKDTLINEALRQLQQTDDEFEKIILSNALLKWNSKAALPDCKITEIKKSNLPFVIANIPSLLNFPFKKVLSNKGIGLFYYYCPAYNNVLLLEHMILKNKRQNYD